MFLEVFVVGLLAGMSPGPDFFIVTKNSMAFGKRIGIASSLGVASALVIHATYSILGLTILMKTFRVLFVTIQLLGAAYLAYLGTVTILSTLKKKSESESRQPEKGRKSFRQGFLNGFLCNILNPKAYIFFLSIFSQFMSSSTALWMEWVYAFEVVLVVGLWFCALSAVISSDVFKKGYRKAEKWIERFFGAVLVFFAVKIVKSAFFGD